VGLRGLRAKFSIADEGGDVRQRDGFREELRDDESTRVTDMVRVLGFCLLAGVVAGLLAGGVGSRLAMRVVALVGSGHGGELTEAQARVGEITVGGTIFLLITGIGAGLLGGLGYFVVRRWIPGRGVWRGLLFGLFLLLVAGSRILDRGNPDFARFVSPSLAIALFAVLFLVYGLLVVWLADRWTRAAPKPPTVRLLATSGYAVVVVVSVAGLVSLVSNLQGILATP
jgi:hypothetical protein